MRLIHKNDFCRDIAIWFDEFLTPGENFNDAIKQALEKSQLFTPVVIPNLVSEQNCVMTVEYPKAREITLQQLKEKYESGDSEIDGADLLSALWYLGDCLADVGKVSDGKEIYREMNLLAEQMNRKNRTDLTDRYLSVSNNKLGDTEEAQGNLTEVKEYYMKCLAISERFAEETKTPDSRRDLYVSYSNLPEIGKAQGSLTEAKEYYVKCLELSESIADETETGKAYDDLAVSYYKLSFFIQLLYMGEGRKDKLTFSYNIWSILSAPCHDDPELSRGSDIAERLLNE